MVGLNHNSKRRGFTLVELLVVIAIIGGLLMLLFPAVQNMREASRRTQCMTNIRSVAQAVQNFESTRMKFPAAMERSYGPLNAPLTKAGATGTAGAYSSFFMLLPYLEDKAVYDNVSNNTGKLILGPYSVGTTSGSTSGGAYSAPNCQLPHAATLTNLSYLQCPSSSVGASVDPTLFWSGSSTGATAADVTVALPGGAAPCGRSAYAAMVGAYMISGSIPSSAAGAIQLAPEVGSSAVQSGLVGVSAGQVADGLTKTMMFIETRERTYSAWIDGCTTWVTAQSGTNTAPIFQNGRWNVSNSALNQNMYMTSAQAGTRFAQSRDWGPSSEHSGGIVVSVFADSHVQPVTGDTDPSVFTAWATRGGSESNGGVTQ